MCPCTGVVRSALRIPHTCRECTSCVEVQSIFPDVFGFSAYILKRKIVVLHEYVGKQSCRWPSEIIAFYAQDTDRWKNHDKVPEYGKLPADAEQEVARVEAAGRSEAILCVGLPELPAVTRVSIALGGTAHWSLILYIFGVKSSVP